MGPMVSTIRKENEKTCVGLDLFADLVHKPGSSTGGCISYSSDVEFSFKRTFVLAVVQRNRHGCPRNLLFYLRRKAEALVGVLKRLHVPR